MITWLMDDVLFSGLGTSDIVPGGFPIALGGHPYLVDLMSDQTGLRGQYFRRASIPVLRAQADTGNIPDETSINPNDLWRRTADTWHLGAGQTHFDRKDSDSSRFRTSKGVNVWTKWQATLLNDTAKVLTSANTNLRMVTAGSYTYLIDGQVLKYSANITAATPSFTTVTSTPAVTASSITTDGFNIYVAYGASGVYTTTRGAATASQLVTSPIDANSVLGYVKGRLMLGSANVLYNITSATPAALPAALYTKSNTDFVWVGFSEGPGQIYCAGFSGDKSLIYRTAVQADGTALTVPVVAGELPSGEIIRSIRGYLDFTVLGSDAGVRLATGDANGNLVIGSLTAVPAVWAFTSYGRWIWFGWSNYDSTSTGVGRMDLSAFTSANTPAYASDLMATAQGLVKSIIEVNGTIVFSVDGVGVFAPTTALVASGTIDSGLINYDLIDPKVAMYLDVHTAPLAGSIQSFCSADSGTFSSVGVNSVAGTIGPAAPYTVGQVKNESIEVRHTLTRDGTTLLGPTLTRWTLRSYAAPDRSYEWIIPLLIHEVIDPENGGQYAMNVQNELDFLFGLLTARQLVTLQVGMASYQVFVEDIDQLPFKRTANGTAYNSTLIVRCKQPQ